MFKRSLQKIISGMSERPVVEAYDKWASSYDHQPGNLILHLDEKIFSGILKNVDLQNKSIADIGCGTGRHWGTILDAAPALVSGYDVSAGMLTELLKKFPSAVTYHTKDALLSSTAAATTDVIISTLTIAHIKKIEAALASWASALVHGGDMVITDLHPAILENGGRRSFRSNNKDLSVKNHIHSLEKIKSILLQNSMKVIYSEEIIIDEKVKHWYEEQGALKIYERFKGLPVIYGLHLKKQHAT